MFLTTQFGPGGAETQILRLALKLRSKGYDVTVISMLKAVGFVDQLHEAKIGYYSLEMKRGRVMPRDLYRLVSLLQTIKPEVIANFCFHANVLGSIAGKLTRTPVIVSSIRGASFGSRKREYIERVLSSTRLSDITVTNSSIVATALAKRGVVSSKRITVIRNGIYCDEYRISNSSRTLVREQLEVKNDEFLWLAVGNVRKEKDYPTLLYSFIQLRERHPNAQLRIAGGIWFDDVRFEVDEILEKHSLHDYVKFLGQRMDVPALMHAADALVLSSITEGLPNAVMEAMATGLPVVATDVGGVRELVEDGVTGYVVPSRNPGQLAEAMSAISSLSPQQRTDMGVQGQQHIRDSFELDIVVEQWENLFLERLKLRNPASAGF